MLWRMSVPLNKVYSSSLFSHGVLVDDNTTNRLNVKQMHLNNTLHLSRGGVDTPHVLPTHPGY